MECSDLADGNWTLGGGSRDYTGRYQRLQTWKKARTREHYPRKIFENCGNFWNVEDYLLLLWNKTLEIKYLTFGIFLVYE